MLEKVVAITILNVDDDEEMDENKTNFIASKANILVSDAHKLSAEARNSSVKFSL